MAVMVDRDFVRVGSKSYALNKINSIDVRERRAGKRGWAIWIVFGVFIAFAGLLGALGAPDAPGLGIAMIVIGLGVAALAWRARNRARRSVYSLHLMTSSGEVQAVESMELEQVQQLRDHIEQGMAAIG